MAVSGRATRFLFVCLLASLGLVIVASTPTSPPGSFDGGERVSGMYAPYVPGEILIKFKNGVPENRRAEAKQDFSAVRLQAFHVGAEQWKLGAGRGVEETIAQLRGHPDVEYVEPNYIVNMELTPNDPRYPELYGLNNTGQTGGTAGADIDAERAWNVSTGSHSVLVAVIDTGGDYNHPDLAANMWTNPGEIPANGIDDDSNGFIDDVRGWDFYNNDNDPFDDNGHGTHCSGTIGAVGNNGIGVAGVNWQVKIVPVKFLGAGGSGSTAAAIAAIDYATSLGVDVMSNSWGGGGFSQALLDSINAAAAAGALFVAAAGNSNTNNDVSPHYPSNYNAPNVVAVAATDDDDNKASFSSYGPTTVDLGAPGVDILSTLPGNSYGLLSGTSMATPHVSGAAALVRAIAPGIGVVELKQLLLNFAYPVPSMAGITVSGGRLNAFFPIAEPDDTPPDAIVDLATETPTSNSMFLRWTATGDDGGIGTASAYDVRYSTSAIDDTNFSSASQAPAPVPQPAGSIETMEVLGLDPGTMYYFAVKAEDEWGNDGPISNIATGTTLPPPTFASSPSSFTAALLTGQSTTRTLTLENAGVGTLDWRIPLPAVSGPVTIQGTLDLEKGDLDPRAGDPVLEGFGGPDTFGYRWMDSDEPGGPAFVWNDIALTGTPITELDLDDEVSAPIPLGFDFSFYGNTFDSVRVCTNGWLSFTSSLTAYSNQPLPTGGTTYPENLLAVFWDDLHFRSANRAVYTTDGSSFIVQFTDVDRYTTGSNLTFQAEIRSTGEIYYRYLSMAGVLGDATIGIQNATRDDGLTVVFNAPYMHDSLEIRIAAVPQWLTAAPTSGRLFGGESEDATLTIDATGLDGGTYEGTVFVETNDPLNPVVPHPVTLDVTGAPAIDVEPDALDFGNVYIGYPESLELRVINTGTDALTVSGIASGDPTVTVIPSSFTVAAHSSVVVDVTYAPTVPGPMSTNLTITSDASNAPSLVVPVTGSADPAPSVLIDPTSYNETLYTGGTVARNLRITNTGGSDLEVTLSALLGTLPTPPEVADLPKGDDSADGTGEPQTAGAGGPDAFGYKWKDSDEPGGPTFNWVDISGVGTEIWPGTYPDDSNVGPFPIGFDFPFYGNDFNTVRVSSNGFLSFTSTSSDLSNSTLPGTGSPENLLAVFHDDIRFYSPNGKAYYYNDGTRFIVQYKDVSDYGQTSSLWNFEVILYPSGKIVYQYLSMVGGLQNSETIGIQNADRTIGLQVVYNANFVHDNMAIEISRTPDWLSVAPASETIPPTEYRDFTVTFNAGDLGDVVLDGAIHIDTNIPDFSVDVPARLTILGVADIATNPESYDYGTRFVGYPALTQLAVQNVGTGDLTVTGATSSDPTLLIQEPVGGAGIFVIPPGGQILYNLRWLPMTPMTLNATVTVTSDDPDEASVVVPVTGTAILAPIAGYSPGSFTSNLFVEQTEVQTLTLTNIGGSNLDFEIGVRLTNATVVPVESPELAKGQEPDQFGQPVTLGSGGPDMYGYRWKDSDEPGGPVFDWVDISAVGTEVFPGTFPDDTNTGPFPIGFDFPFYGNMFDTVRVCSNGFLSFTSTSTDLSNSALPGTGSPENLLAVFHDDLRFYSSNNAKAYYYNDGSRLIVQYENVSKYLQETSSLMNFEVILYPSGKVVYQYLTMTGTLTSATIGVQNATRDDGLQIVYDQAYMHDNLAIVIQAIPDWLSVPTTSGTIPPGGSLDIPVQFSSVELIGGTYTGGLALYFNDPALGAAFIPATMYVTGYPGIAADPASLDFGTVFVGVTSNLDVTISNPGSDVLDVTSVTITGDYTTDTSPFTLAVGETRTLTVTFAPSDDGTRPGDITIESNATGVPTFVVPLTGEGLYPPIAGVDPESIEMALPPGGAGTRTVMLCNTGGSDLVWTANVSQSSLEEPVNNEPWEALPKYDESANGAGDGIGITRAGGPDLFGYQFKDSDEPGGPAYEWVEISGIGTPLFEAYSDDGNRGPFPIGFDFPFYGNTFDTLRACSNGWLSFTSTLTGFSNASSLPNSGSSVPENLLATFWDDMVVDPTDGGEVYYYNDGTRLIVQFNVRRIAGFTPPFYEFQVHLYPSGKIVYQYKQFGSTINSATIGIQNATKDDGLLVSYNESAYLHPEMAIEFSAGPEWIVVSPESGVLPAGDCTSLVLDVDAAGLDDGDYEALLTVTSNDPFNGLIEVPVLLHVGEVDLTYIDVEPHTLNLGSNGNTVKATIQLPPEYDPHDIVISSVSIYGVLFANPSPIGYSDVNDDGILELFVKFDRQAFQALVPEGDNVPVTVTGEVRDTIWFRGTDTIRAIHPQLNQPNGGEYVAAGQTQTISWNTPAAGTPNHYNLWLSRNGGETWEVLAEEVSSTSYDWTVDGAPTMQARVRVLAMDNQGVMGYDTSDGDFAIASVLMPPNPAYDLLVSLDQGDVVLEWKQPATDLDHGPATQYHVMRSTSAAGSFDEIGTTAVGIFRDPIAGQGEASMLFFKIVASNAAGSSIE